MHAFARLLTCVPAVTHFICPLWSPVGTQPGSLMLLTPTWAPGPAAALAAGREASQLALVPPDARGAGGTGSGLS